VPAAKYNPDVETIFFLSKDNYEQISRIDYTRSGITNRKDASEIDLADRINKAKN